LNNESKAAQEQTITDSCDDMLTWLKSVGQQLQVPLSLSARDDVLKEQIRTHQVDFLICRASGKVLDKFLEKMAAIICKFSYKFVKINFYSFF